MKTNEEINEHKPNDAQNLSEVEIYHEILKKEFKLFTQSDIAAFLGVHQTTIASWIQRNSVKTLRKYLIDKRLDIAEIDKKVQKYQEGVLLTTNKPLYSPLFQKIIAKKEKELWNILVNEIKPSTEEEKLEFFKDFRALIEATVSPQVQIELFNEQHNLAPEIIDFLESTNCKSNQNL